ncbi:MAG: hypothetical protein COW30_02570 [Rhodospirillales bacterium CG15_BIG_FIL_POST_REV_8_21_14_020_66_15]|nr:MAG: hypothetical protein COW30_02570 [Rhodospirillales bacterium CG15_BIG_FIL_POST_REV_8_21_14_020_66_15]
MIGTIEQAIIDRIAAASSGATPALGYAIRDVKSYGGELEGDFTEIAKRFPAALVMFAGIRSSEHLGGEAWRYTAGFVVMVGHQDRRNNKSARRGVGDDAGSYQMATDMLQLLVGSDLGLGIGYIEPGRIVALINSKTVSVYSVEISTTFDIEYQAPDADLDAFVTLHTDWDVPTFGNVSTNLPAGDADAEDTINPEQV